MITPFNLEILNGTLFVLDIAILAVLWRLLVKYHHDYGWYSLECQAAKAFLVIFSGHTLARGTTWAWRLSSNHDLGVSWSWLENMPFVTAATLIVMWGVICLLRLFMGWFKSIAVVAVAFAFVLATAMEWWLILI